MTKGGVLSIDQYHPVFEFKGSGNLVDIVRIAGGKVCLQDLFLSSKKDRRKTYCVP
jgi:hypothetical protein